VIFKEWNTQNGALRLERCQKGVRGIVKNCILQDVTSLPFSEQEILERERKKAVKPVPGLVLVQWFAGFFLEKQLRRMVTARRH